MKERKWTSIPPYPASKGRTLSTEISKWVMRLIGHFDQDADGAVHWNSIHPKLSRAFRDRGARNSSDKDWLQNIYEGSSKTRFEYCTDSKNSLLYLRAIQGHTGGHIIVPELMNHLEIPYNWREFVFHRGCSFNMKSILETGLIAGGKERKEGRQTISFTLPNPFAENSDEEGTKAHYHSNWKHD